MAAVITHDAYGKSRVRVTKLTRSPGRTDIKQLDVAVELQGDFAAGYVTGDSSRVVATDSIKNTVYALASDHAVRDIESFGVFLGRHFVKRYAHVDKVTVNITEDLWERIGGAHPTSFVGGNSEKRTALVVVKRNSDVNAKNADGTRAVTTHDVVSGIKGLQVLMSAGSEFFGFLRDEFATLSDTFDRIFATTVVATWRHASAPNEDSCAKASAYYNKVYADIRRAMVTTVSNHHSLSVQQTQYAAGQAMLDACPGVATVTLTMPNSHHIPFNLAPLGGRQNRNEIFTPTDEPHGLITVTVARPPPKKKLQAKL